MYPAQSTSRMRNEKRWSPTSPATQVILTARSNADGRYDRWFSRAQMRRRVGNEKLVARLAVPRHHNRYVEDARASASLSPCVQRKIWVKIGSKGRRFLASRLRRDLGGFLLLPPMLQGSLGRRSRRDPSLGLLHKPGFPMQEPGFSFRRETSSIRRAMLTALSSPP